MEPREFKSPEHERAYILRMAANACKDLLKSHWRRTTVAMEGRQPHSRPGAGGGKPVGRSEPAGPPSTGPVIYLYTYEGYSSKEIARLLGRNPATVATQLRRGRTQLKDLLESEGSS